MRRDIEFRTEDGVVLRGWHYVQERAGRTPTVVMAHGRWQLGVDCGGLAEAQ